ncbi:alanine racemase [Microbacterium betulae]|uniref:Alanine racemase n=1 Tax=Microbacterium betulae TaxID=2981139 RepID=A0AA97FFJ0_9MICO|nr:alanine racemase [Microbacterium sp. AB]WOF22223.1 alanine racemase [Microbacterium sp. AB]
MSGERSMREAVVDRSAIVHNVRHLREVAGTPEFIAVVKADGYGHGAATSALAAIEGGATRIGVAEIPEALALRAAGVRAPIIAWLHDPVESFAEAVSAGIELGVSRIAQLEEIAAAGDAARASQAGLSPAVSGDARRASAPKAHLKLETGLGRNGLAPDDWHAAFAEAARLEAEGRLVVEGVFSHLSGTSDADDLAQVRVFEEGVGAASAAGLRPRLRHVAATAAAIRLPEARFDAVRVGIGIYGLSPFDDATSADLGLRPAMTLRGRVAAVRRVPTGQGVSYGYAHRTVRETTLALVPLGYADGVPRQASGTAPVAIGGERFRVSGRIAMDQFVVDVGDHPVAVGDEVLLFGDPAAGAPAVEEWARAAGTINYEIVTRVGPRVARRATG